MITLEQMKEHFLLLMWNASPYFNHMRAIKSENNLHGGDLDALTWNVSQLQCLPIGYIIRLHVHAYMMHTHKIHIGQGTYKRSIRGRVILYKIHREEG